MRSSPCPQPSLLQSHLKTLPFGFASKRSDFSAVVIFVTSRRVGSKLIMLWHLFSKAESGRSWLQINENRSLGSGRGLSLESFFLPEPINSL